MNVNEYLSKEIWYTVPIMPLKYNTENPIDRKMFADLYDFFDNYPAESFHTLVQDVNLEITPEFYVLINETGLERDGFAAEFGYKVSRTGSVLTWFLVIFDDPANPLNVPFIYDLAARGVSFELLKLSEFKRFRVYFIERMPDGELYERYYSTVPVWPELWVAIERQISAYLKLSALVERMGEGST